MNLLIGTFLKLFIAFLIVIALGMYLVIVGGNINKTDEERRLEDEEQMNYLKNYKKRKIKDGGKYETKSNC